MRRGIERIGAICIDIAYIFSKDYKLPSRTKLLRDYLRMRLKVFLNRWIYFKYERFLGFTVVFANYSLFFEEFRQTFVRQSYYFETDKESPSVIDCGGNMGMSLLYFKYLYPKSKVTVFEPSAEILPVIRENIRRNSLEHVNLEEYAVAEKDGEASFFDRGTGSCGSTLVESVFKADAHSRQNKNAKSVVKTRKLSHYVKSPIDMLKLDIEGAEGAVIEELHGAKALGMIRDISLEYHYYSDNCGNSLGKMLAMFEQEGRDYQIFLDEISPEASLSLMKNGGYYCLLKSSIKKS